MKFLAINTAGDCAVIAAQNGELQSGWFDPDFRRASEVLLPAIDSTLSDIRLALAQADFIACVIGPGSFTGIRIGISTARAFSYALNIPCVAVNYLQAMAYNKQADGAESIISIADGSNGTAYLAAYDQQRNTLLAPCVMTVEQADAFVATVDEPRALVCDRNMSERYGGIRASCDPDTLLRAATANAHNKIDFAMLTPLYIRVSQAEQDLMQKSGAKQ